MDAQRVRACAAPRLTPLPHGQAVQAPRRKQGRVAATGRGPQLQVQGGEPPGRGALGRQGVRLQVLRGWAGPWLGAGAVEGPAALSGGGGVGPGGEGAGLFVPSDLRSPRCPRRTHLLCSSLIRTMRLRWPWEYCSMTSLTS